MAATQDRVPTVYLENGKVQGLDKKDPIQVSYKENFEGQTTGLNSPDSCEMMWHHGHNGTIINGIPRIGFMKGGASAKWKDVDMADNFSDKMKDYIKDHKDKPFFLYYAMQQPHVPRTPNPRFVGKSGMGPRGDVILEADWCVGELVKILEKEGILEKTLIVFSSDNGPVVNDGYNDDAVEKLGKHKPSGNLKGGKYSLFEAGTRIPLITYWKGTIDPKVSDALVCQMDILASLERLLGATETDGLDSENMLDVFLGKSNKGREGLIIEATSRTALRQGDWLMIPAYNGEKVNTAVNIELGNSSVPMLFNLKEDEGQSNNLAQDNPDKLNEMMDAFISIRGENYKNIQELDLK